MRFSLIPRDEQFFALYRAVTNEIRQASLTLEAMFAVEPPDPSKAALLKDAEHRCDTLTHDTIQRLHRTFITPFDREDLYALATSLDNVMDTIDHAASLVALYRITTLPPGARELAHTVTQSAERLHLALEALAERKPVQPHAVEINRLENEADHAYQEAVRRLFDTVTDPILLIKWKDLLDELERITDCCEDVANVIEGVVVKHG
ncbi:MAG: DUF47 family protein [Vicinamibacterales bacterium]